MRFSSTWRVVLRSQSSSASSAALSISVASKSSTAIDALLTRPAALMRGAKTKPIKPELIFLFFGGNLLSPTLLPDAASIRARKPGRLVSSKSLRPRATIRRFSSTIGITSAMVPMATRSAYSRQICRTPSISGRPSRRHLVISNAQISLKTTPTPARSLKGYSSSGR